MEITKTLLINAACLLIPPVVVVLLLRHFFPRKIRWSAGVVALVDLVIFWTDIFYYESVWLTLFFVVIQLAMVLLISIRLYKKDTRKLKCTLCQGHYDFSFSDFYFIFVCCVEASK